MKMTAEELLEAVNAELVGAAQRGSPYHLLQSRIDIGHLLYGVPDEREIEACLEALRRMKGLAVALRLKGRRGQDPTALAELMDEWLAPVFEAPR